MPEQCNKVVSAIFSQPWAILPEELEAMIAIANRDVSDLVAAAEKRESRESSLAGIPSGAVAVVPVFGPIVPRATLFDDVSGAVSLSRLSALLDEALTDPEIGAVLLNIDSPGGQVTGIHEFAERIRAGRNVKPIDAHVTGMCASAAYWIASACGAVTADETAKIGSIGVVYAWTDDSAAKEKQGFRDYVVVSAQSPDKYLDPKTKAGRSELQRLADGTAAIFIRNVARNRETTVADVEKNYGKGKVMLAGDALEAGMIDGIGVMDVVLGNLTGHNIQELSMAKNGKSAPRSNPKNKARNGNAEKDPERDDEDEEDEEEARAEQNGGSPRDKDEEEEEDAEGKEGDEDEDEDKPKSRGKASGKPKAAVDPQNFKASYPEAYKAAFQAGVLKERARIRAIRELGVVGHDELIEQAMFDAPMSAEKLSLAILKAEGTLRKDLGSAIATETANVYAKTTPVAPGPSSANDDADIALMAGLPMTGDRK